jgi:ferric-dicitrate binding protein FerR (iron transport regulator)
MSSCRRMRDAIVEVVRRQATEADRLRLEQHLATCRSCGAEKAQWLLMEHLDATNPQRLSPDARTRILGRLTDLPELDVSDVRRAPRWSPALMGGTLVVAAAAALLLLLPGRHRADGSVAAVARDLGPQPVLTGKARPETIHAQTAGTLEAGRAHIIYAAGTALDVLPGDSALELLAGELDVDVTPGGPEHFRVITPRFTVEVLGTRFIVNLDRVMTLRGVVRVVTSDASGGRPIALVRAGQTWSCPESLAKADLAGNAAAGPGLEPASERPNHVPSSGSGEAEGRRALADSPIDGSDADGVARDRTTHGTAAAPNATALAGSDSARSPRRSTVARRTHAANPPSVSVEQSLADARAALATGNSQRARVCVATALRGRPKARQRAMADLLSADALLVESRYDAAVAAYRRTMDRFAVYPEGETAAFALAQLLSERGPEDRAHEALVQYLAHYPTGRFAEEVARKLTNTPPR